MRHAWMKAAGCWTGAIQTPALPGGTEIAQSKGFWRLGTMKGQPMDGDGAKPDGHGATAQLTVRGGTFDISRRILQLERQAAALLIP